jgi:hypothetical protein
MPDLGAFRSGIATNVSLDHKLIQLDCVPIFANLSIAERPPPHFKAQ